MAPVVIRPSTPADAVSVANIHYRALERYHEFYGAFFALGPRETLTRSTAAALQKPENVFLVAVDEGGLGEVVGFVRYAVEAGKVAAAAEKQDEAAPAGPLLYAVKEHMKELWEAFGKKQAEIDGCYERTLNGQKHIYVYHLMIEPDHQRKGIGGKLLGAVLERSDKERLPAFLVSSAESRGLYGRMGFESLGTWRIDNGDWAARIAEVERGLGIRGNEGLEDKFRGLAEVEDAMIRWPKKGLTWLGDGAN
ncbi:acyl-CoA N-acyltransferase [Trichoderma ceciliae]